VLDDEQNEQEKEKADKQTISGPLNKVYPLIL
jgi:hypothetical protein